MNPILCSKQVSPPTNEAPIAPPLDKVGPLPLQERISSLHGKAIIGIAISMLQERFTLSPIVSVFVLLFLLAGCKQPCKDVDCVNGSCIDGNCLCNTGWTGSNCAQVDACLGRTCNNGYCHDGSCLCDPLWDGNNCSEPINQKFIGNWSVSETCDAAGVMGYSVVIFGIGTSLDQFRITNLYNTGTVTGQVLSDKHSFSIPEQAIASGFEIEASTGTISSDGRTVTLNYRIQEAGTKAIVDACSATWVKY